MHEVSAAQLLDAWEATGGLSPHGLALALLEATGDAPAAQGSALDLPVGERDRRLLRFRERVFGTTLASAARCRACGEELELTFSIRDILVEGPGADPGALRSALPDGREVAFRLPTTRDLLALDGAADAEDARLRLVRRCVADVDGHDVDPAALGEAEIEVIEAAMAAADPQADVVLEATCEACGAPVQAVFDIAGQVRAELGAWSRRTLHEVATLAAAYGWTERDILAMSAWRRQAYLQAAGA